MKKHYDYLFVGAGLFNAVLAYRARKMGYSCLVVEERDEAGGNCATEMQHGIMVHKYGAHIFHTSDREVWEFVNRFGEFNHFINSPIAITDDDELYNLPFNMNTLSKMFGVHTPYEARKCISDEIDAYTKTIGVYDQWQNGTWTPENLEQQAVLMVGIKIYQKLIKGYTEKQWGAPCTKLPASIIKRIPIRCRYDNNYFNDSYQGIPSNGYSDLIMKMFDGCDMIYGVDFLENDNIKKHYMDLADHVFYSGRVDRYYKYEFGVLEYRSLRFDQRVEPFDQYTQGNAVVNYTGSKTPYTRVIEHLYFDVDRYKGPSTYPAFTIKTYEYPAEWRIGKEPFYPMTDAVNRETYRKYINHHNASEESNKVEFTGRLGLYQYLDMDKVVRRALDWPLPEKPTAMQRVIEAINTLINPRDL